MLDIGLAQRQRAVLRQQRLRDSLRPVIGARRLHRRAHRCVSLAKAHARLADKCIGQLGYGDQVAPGSAREFVAVELRGLQEAFHQTQCARGIGKRRDTSGWRSSSLSLTSPKGVLWAQVNMACASPSARLARMRACSSATGLRFWGMMLEDCTNASERRRNPTPRRPQQQVLHELAEIHHGYRHASGCFGEVIDRSDGSVEFSARASKPSRRAVTSRSIGKPVVVMAQAPSGSQVDVRKGSPDARRIPRQKLGAGQQVVSQRGGLRRLGMGVRRHHRLEMIRRQRQQRGASLGNRFGQLQHFPPQRHPVKRDGDIVAAARRVHLARKLAAGALQKVLDEEEQVLAKAVVACPRYFCQGKPAKRVQENRCFGLRQDSLARQHPGVGEMNLDERSRKYRLAFSKLGPSTVAA